MLLTHIGISLLDSLFLSKVKPESENPTFNILNRLCLTIVHKTVQVSITCFQYFDVVREMYVCL